MSDCEGTGWSSRSRRSAKARQPRLADGTEWWHEGRMKSEASCERVAARPVPEVRGYVLEEVIGRGGAGVVWRGVQEGTLRNQKIAGPVGFVAVIPNTGAERACFRRRPQGGGCRRKESFTGKCDVSVHPG
jgi:hypothetical protein